MVLDRSDRADLYLGAKIQPKVFLTEVFGNPLGVVDVRAFGSWMSAPKCLFFQDLTALTEVLGQDICANDPRMSAGCPSQKLPLWADFSFLNLCLGVSAFKRPCNRLAVKKHNAT